MYFSGQETIIMATVILEPKEYLVVFQRSY